MLHLSLRHPAYRAQRSRLLSLVKRAVKATGEEKEFSILLTDDAALQALNRDFRGKDKPTNVLSFPSDQAPYLGDIAISLDTVAREAEAQDKLFEHHLTHMVVHAVLHLQGHDHETEEDASRMEPREVEILARLGIHNPYD